MFAQFCSLALLSTLAVALTIDPLVGANSQGPAEIKWNNEAADTSRFATFSVFLHHPSFRDDFALLNNVRPSEGGANITLPVVPAQDGYTLRATNIGNINDEFAQSAPFFIGGEVSSSIASTSTTSSSSVASGSVTRSGAGSTLSVPPPLPTSTPAFGTTLVNTNTPNANSLPASGSGTSSAPTSSSTLTSFNAASRVSGSVLGAMVISGLVAAFAL